MKAYIIQVGYTKGVRLPKAWLEQGNFGEVVDMEIRDEGILIRPAPATRPVGALVSSEGTLAEALARGDACFLGQGSWLD